METGILICPKDKKPYYRRLCEKKDCYTQYGCNIDISRKDRMKVNKAETESSAPAKLSDLSITKYIPADRLRVLIDLYHILSTNMESSKEENPFNTVKDTALMFLIYELYHLLLLSKYGNYTSQPYDEYIELQPKNIVSALKKDLKVQGVDKDTLRHLTAGDTEKSKERWTFPKEIGEVLIFLGIAVKKQQYYHSLNNRIKNIISVPPDGYKQPHPIYKPVINVLLQPKSLQALTQYCQANKERLSEAMVRGRNMGSQAVDGFFILEPLSQYVPRFYAYITQPAFHKKSNKEQAQKLRAIFEEDPIQLTSKSPLPHEPEDRLHNHPEKDGSWIYKYAAKKELIKKPSKKTPF
jgi:hypothetical protein